MEKTTLYVAETNDEGHIAWIWIAQAGQRSSKPFDPAKDRFDPSRRAEFAGAGQMAIRSWLAASTSAGR
jgi:hypothetical protein